MPTPPDARPALDDRPEAEPGPAAPFSRRSFLRASALTAGAATLPLSACGTGRLGPPAEAPERMRTGLAFAPGKPWVEPVEWDVREHGDDALQLSVNYSATSAEIRTNALSGGTPSSPQGPDKLFNYNGSTPGPTVRMGGNDVLRVKLTNNLAGNNGTWARANGSRFATAGHLYPEAPSSGADNPRHDANDVVPAGVVDWKLSRNLVYGPHLQHTTNLHTHGLHVRPGPNPVVPGGPQTHSDNVMLRVIPQEDYDNRMAHDPPLPLSQGLEGDPQHVEVVKTAAYEFQLGTTSGTPIHPPGTHWYHPHPHGATYDQVAAGMAGFLIVEGDVDDALAAPFSDSAYNYRERLMMLQRVFDISVAPIENEEGGPTEELSNVRGKASTSVQTVNGRVAGSLGFEMEAGAAERWRVLNGSVDGNGYVMIAVTPADRQPPAAQSAWTAAQYQAALNAWVDANALPMINTAFDGVTLVSEAGRYHAIEVDALHLSPANRADFLFQAPPTAGAYQVWGVSVTHRVGDPPQKPVVIADLTVTARSGPPPPVPLATVNAALASLTVPEHLQPVSDDDLRDANRKVRTRQVVYSGWGGSGYPATCNDLGPQALFQTAETPPPGRSKNSMTISRTKYDPNQPVQLMGLDTAEEWVVDNFSVKSSPDVMPLPARIKTGGAVDHPFHMHQNPFYVLAILEPRWTPDPGLGEVALDANPEYVNTLPTPRWQDVVAIPANGGRVIFRSRFPDYAGFFVNHCHILQHEDWGMMQAVEVIDPADSSETRTPNYDEHDAPYPTSDPNGTTLPYAKPTPAVMIRYCETFLDLDGTVTQGGRIEGATTQSYCT